MAWFTVLLAFLVVSVPGNDNGGLFAAFFLLLCSAFFRGITCSHRQVVHIYTKLRDACASIVTTLIDNNFD